MDAFFEAAATIVVASLTATPPVNLQEITKKLALLINVEIKILAIYSDIIILFLPLSGMFNADLSFLCLEQVGLKII